MASEINLMKASNIIDFSKWIFYIKKFLWVEEKQDGPTRAVYVFPNFLFMATTKQKDHFKEQIKAVGKRVTGDSDRFLFYNFILLTLAFSFFVTLINL